MNLNNFKKIYLIGIKGVGMTAVAQVLKLRGKEVSGDRFVVDVCVSGLVVEPEEQGHRQVHHRIVKT